MTKTRKEASVHWSNPPTYALRGKLEFDPEFAFLGHRGTKRCKVVCAFTPGEWPYFDLKAKTITAQRDRR